jgi:hypothetical protein
MSENSTTTTAEEKNVTSTFSITAKAGFFCNPINIDEVGETITYKNLIETWYNAAVDANTSDTTDVFGYLASEVLKKYEEILSSKYGHEKDSIADDNENLENDLKTGITLETLSEQLRNLYNGQNAVFVSLKHPEKKLQALYCLQKALEAVELNPQRGKGPLSLPDAHVTPTTSEQAVTASSMLASLRKKKPPVAEKSADDIVNEIQKIIKEKFPDRQENFPNNRRDIYFFPSDALRDVFVQVINKLKREGNFSKKNNKLDIALCSCDRIEKPDSGISYKILKCLLLPKIPPFVLKNLQVFGNRADRDRDGPPTYSLTYTKKATSKENYKITEEKQTEIMDIIVKAYAYFRSNADSGITNLNFKVFLKETIPVISDVTYGTFRKGKPLSLKCLGALFSFCEAQDPNFQRPTVDNGLLIPVPDENVLYPRKNIPEKGGKIKGGKIVPDEDTPSSTEEPDLESLQLGQFLLESSGRC